MPRSHSRILPTNCSSLHETFRPVEHPRRARVHNPSNPRRAWAVLSSASDLCQLVDATASPASRESSRESARNGLAPTRRADFPRCLDECGGDVAQGQLQLTIGTPHGAGPRTRLTAPAQAAARSEGPFPVVPRTGRPGGMPGRDRFPAGKPVAVRLPLMRMHPPAPVRVRQSRFGHIGSDTAAKASTRHRRADRWLRPRRTLWNWVQAGSSSYLAEPPRWAPRGWLSEIGSASCLGHCIVRCQDPATARATAESQLTRDASGPRMSHVWMPSLPSDQPGLAVLPDSRKGPECQATSWQCLERVASGGGT